MFKAKFFLLFLFLILEMEYLEIKFPLLANNNY